MIILTYLIQLVLNLMIVILYLLKQEEIEKLISRIFHILTTILEDAGFENIELWDWREVFSSNLDYDDHSQAYYPHMDKENGTHISLNIQCSKK